MIRDLLQFYYSGLVEYSLLFDIFFGGQGYNETKKTTDSKNGRNWRTVLKMIGEDPGSSTCKGLKYLGNHDACLGNTLYTALIHTPSNVQLNLRTAAEILRVLFCDTNHA